MLVDWNATRRYTSISILWPICSSHIHFFMLQMYRLFVDLDSTLKLLSTHYSSNPDVEFLIINM